jgi:uncharacterized protein YjiS (DUF1127 family)
MTSIGLSPPFSRARATFGVGLARAIPALWARWRAARDLAETRRYLALMDDHMLKDLGVSRAQAYFEVEGRGRR